MPGRLVSPRTVGRTAQLDALARALDSAAAGNPTHQLISGEAGVGKSRLVADVTTMAAARGFRVLAGGNADIGDGGVPYGPITEALRDLIRQLPADRLEAVVGPSRADLARLVPALGQAADDATQTEYLQPRLLDAVLGVLQRLGTHEPVLLVIEDLHWADPASRDTIASLIRQLRGDPVLILLSFRSDELQRRHPLHTWLAELGRSGRVERHDLPRLDRAETRELLAAILGDAPTPELVGEIHRRSDGNPFFVEELLGAGGQGGRLPPTLREVLLARLVALPDEAQAVVRVAAVAGRRIDHDLLAHVGGLEEPALTDSLRAAIGGHVLVAASGEASDGDYVFRHALLQEAAYQDLLPGERQRLHRAVAEAIAERGPHGGNVAGHCAALAYHWSAAREDRRAFEAAVSAGDAAARTFAFADALRQDEKALELWAIVEEPETLAGISRAQLIDRAAVAAWLSGDTHRAVSLRREALTEIQATGDPLRIGTAMERLGRALWSNGEVEAALEMHETAIVTLPAEPPSAELARALAGYAQVTMLVDRWEESRFLAERAVAMAREVGARQAEGHALNTLGLDLAALGETEAGEAALEEALTIAREIRSADDVGRGWVNLSQARRYGGDPVGVLELVRRGVAETDEMGLGRTYGSFLRENGMEAAFELGHWAEGTDLARDSVQLPHKGSQSLRYGLTRWVPFLVAQGDERAAGVLDELRALLEGATVEAQFHAPYRAAAIERALWHGDPSTALSIARRASVELNQGIGHWYVLRIHRLGLRAAADVAEIARARRDEAGEAHAIADGDGLWARLEALAADARSRLRGKAALETEAELATAEAERRRLHREATATAWAQAVEAWQAWDNPYLQAYCRYREAEAHLGDGQRAVAEAALRAAYEAAGRLGAAPMVATIVGLATRARIDVTPATAPTAVEAPPAGAGEPADPFGLTRRERDVLPLLVQGRTNRQIAEALFISENTAGVHVSNILGKLGASTRTEAAGIAARLGMGTSSG